MNDQPEVKQRKKPGPKPRHHDTSGMTQRDMDQAGVSADPREAAAHEPDRPKRVTMQGALKLTVPPGLIKADYTARWFRDKDARITQAQGAYWEYIKDAEGKNLSRPSGPYILYAMQLPNKYAEEDRALKRAKIAARISKEAAIAPNEYSDHGTDSALSVEGSNPYSS